MDSPRHGEYNPCGFYTVLTKNDRHQMRHSMKFALIAKNRMFPDRSGWSNHIKVLGADVFARITADTDAVIVPNNIEYIDDHNYADVFTPKQYEAVKHHQVPCVRLAYIELCVAYRRKLDMEDYMVKMPWPTPIKLDESSDESDTMELDAAAVVDNVTASPVSQPSEPPSVPFAQPAPPASPLFDDSSIDTSIAFENLPAVEMVALDFCTNSQPPSPRPDSHSSCSSLDGLAPNKDQPRKPMSTVNDVVAQFLAIKKERLSLQKRSELSLQRSLQWELETHCCKDSQLSEPLVATTTTTTTRELPEPMPLLQPIEDNFRQKLPAKKRRIAYTPPAAAATMPSLQVPFRQEEPQRDVVPPWRGEQSDEVLTAAAAIMDLFPTMPSSPSKPDVSRREHGAILPRVEPVITVKRKAKSPRKPRKAPKQVPVTQPIGLNHRLSATTTAPFVVTPCSAFH